MNRRDTMGFLAAMAMAWSAGCGATPATAEQQAQAERRLLAPFLAPREVGCDALLVELTGNFDDNVARPAVDASRHDFRREPGDGFVDHVWTNRAGTADAAFVITIGEPPQLGEQGWRQGASTKFRVVNQLCVRVFAGRHALTLRASTVGDYAFVKDGTGKARDVRRFTIPDDVPARP